MRMRQSVSYAQIAFGVPAADQPPVQQLKHAAFGFTCVGR